MGYDLDAVDRGVLFLLQQDARNATARGMADKLDVSASTIRNRIDQLKANDVLIGYRPLIDYENTDLPHRTVLIVTVPPAEQSDIAEKILDIPGVINVREMLISQQYIYVEVLAKSSNHLSQLMNYIHELNVKIELADLIKQRRVQPLTFFEDALEPDE